VFGNETIIFMPTFSVVFLSTTTVDAKWRACRIRRLELIEGGTLYTYRRFNQPWLQRLKSGFSPRCLEYIF